VRFLVRRQFSEEMGDTAGGVMGSELDAPTAGLPQAADERSHEPEHRAWMVGNKFPKLVCGDHPDGQRIDRHRARQARFRVKGSDLTNQLAGCAYTQERFVAVFGGHDDFDPAFEDHDHEIAGVTLAKHARVARVSTLTPASEQIGAFRFRQCAYKPFG
jgi:hypothetical protein